MITRALRIEDLEQRLLLTTAPPLLPGDVVTVEVDIHQPTEAIEPSFVGVGNFYSNIQSYYGANPAELNGSFVTLLNELGTRQGAPKLRINGTSTSNVWWNPNNDPPPTGGPPDITIDLTQDLLDVVDDVATQLGSQLSMGVNMGRNDLTLASDMAQAIVNNITPANLELLEIGNEPDMYESNGYRAASYDFDDFLTEYDSFLSQLRLDVGPVTMAGPAFSFTEPVDVDTEWNGRFDEFVTEFATDDVRFTSNRYPTSDCTNDPSSPRFPSIENILSDRTAHGNAQIVAPHVADATAAGGSFRLTEHNTASCGGRAGTSDTFASALWFLDATFAAASVGVEGVHVPAANSAAFTPFKFQDLGSGNYLTEVFPLYYGMLFFAEAASDGSNIVELDQNTGSNVRTWATRDDADVLRVLVINKDLNDSGLARISIPGVDETGSLARLTAPTVSSMTGIDIAGQTFDGTTDGSLVGTRTEDSIDRSADGLYEFQMPASSAAILTIQLDTAAVVAAAGPDIAQERYTDVMLDATNSQGSGLTYLWQQMSGPTVTLGNANTSMAQFVPTELGTYEFSLMVTDGSTVSSDNVVVEIQDAGAFGNYVESNGMVVIEGEVYAGIESGQGDFALHDWTAELDPLASDGKAIEATPNTGSETGDTTDGTAIRYSIDFTTTGTWYVLARVREADFNSDQLHLGLDAPVTYGGNGIRADADWAWKRKVSGLSGDNVVKIVVDQPGVRDLRVWMIEDGVFLDKVVLTTDSQLVYSDTDLGPAATYATTPTPPPPPPPAVDDFFSLPEDSTAVPLAVLDNDVPSAQLANFTNPTNGTLQLQNGALTYTPNADYDGADSFTYTVFVSGNESDPATVTLQVNASHEQAQTAVNPAVAPELTPSGSFLEVEKIVQVPLGLNGSQPRVNSMAFAGDRIFVATDGTVSGEGKIYEIIQDSTGNSVNLFFDVGAAVFSATGRVLDNTNFVHGGLRSLAFHPEFATNGKFYTSIMEERPTDPSQHTFLSDVATPITADSVVVEWTYDHVLQQVTSSSYREVFRVGLFAYDHPIKGLAFDPFASPGDENYGLLFVGHGDGSLFSTVVGTGQNNDALGKVLRIDPLENGGMPYSVPASNPFVNDGTMLDEVYALGFRNPHNLSFAQNSSGNSELIVTEIGRDNIDEVNVVAKGANYGWGDREGPFVSLTPVGINDGIGPLPTNEANNGFTYPAAFYGHEGATGETFTAEAIAGGHVIQNGSSDLDDQFLFVEFASDGRIYQVDFSDMLQQTTLLDPNDPNADEPSELTWVTPQEITVLFDHDNDIATLPLVRGSLKDVLDDEPDFDEVLTGGCGCLTRADLRLGQGPDGELYILNKRNGWIYLARNTAPPISLTAPEVVTAGEAFALNIDAFGNSMIVDWGDGSTESGDVVDSILHTYSVTGELLIVVTTIDASGQTLDSASFTIQIVPAGDKVGTHQGNTFSFDVDGNGIWDPNVDQQASFGLASDVPIVGDWSGSGSDNLGVHRGNQFWLDANGNDVWDGTSVDIFHTFGLAGDTPLVGDWDGDGVDNIGVHRGQYFWLDVNGNGQWDGAVIDTVYSFGVAGDTAIIGDWDGDGTDNIGVHRDQYFWLDMSGNGSWDGPGGGDVVYSFGVATDTPVIGDWDGDGTTNVGVRRGNFYWLDQNGDGQWSGATVDKVFEFGVSNDTPLAGDWT